MEIKSKGKSSETPAQISSTKCSGEAHRRTNLDKVLSKKFQAITAPRAGNHPRTYNSIYTSMKSTIAIILLAVREEPYHWITDRIFANKAQSNFSKSLSTGLLVLNQLAFF
jgi:hypothetical protein